MKATTSFPTTVPGSASGPQPAGGPAAGIHAAASPDGGFPGATLETAGSGGTLTTMWRFAALVSFLVMMAWFCASCANVKHGQLEVNAFGADIKGLKTPEVEIAEINTSNVFGVVERTADKAGKWWAWGKFWDFGGDVVNGLKDVVSDNNDTDQAINASNNATKEAVETFVPPEPEVPAP